MGPAALPAARWGAPPKNRAAFRSNSFILIKRGKTWHFRWSLPDKYRPIAGKNEIHKNLKTDSESEAKWKAADLKRKLKAEFDAVLGGMVASLPKSYADTVKRAADLGFEYQPAADLAKGDIRVLLQRIARAEQLSPDATNGPVIAAYAGKSGWSALVNKYLRENQVLPSGHTIGGLRHSWEGRMRRAGIAIDDRGIMMGHRVTNIRNRE